MSFIRSVRTSNMKTIVGLLIAIAVSAVTRSAPAALIISQYYEGVNPNDKFIEIFNTGPSSVDLGATDVRLGLWSNSSRRETWKTSGAPSAFIQLTGIIDANSNYLIKNDGATAPSYVVANLNNTTVINFVGGDDSVVLYTGATYDFANVIDAFGVAGTNTYQDTSYVRNATVTSGTNADFNAAQWTQFSLAAVASASPTSNERLGFHAIPEPSTFALAGFGLIGLVTVTRRRRSA